MTGFGGGAAVGLALEQVVPWGRSLAEYAAMFDLTPADLGRRILDCGGGPASFTAELAAGGGRVVSCDPIYRFAAAEIARRVEETYPVLLAGVEAERERFVWTRIGSPRRLGELRLAAMRRFVADLDAGRAPGRYVVTGLPDLPFAAGGFDLALCSHVLFLYADRFDAGFHARSLREMVRVAGEARVFPLLDLGGRESPHLGPVVEELAAAGYEPRVREVPHEFQRGGNRMLVVTAPERGRPAAASPPVRAAVDGGADG